MSFLSLIRSRWLWAIVGITAFAVLGSEAFAANTPAGFDAQKWNALVEQVIQKGTVGQTTEGEWRTLSHITPSDIAKPHQADYISTLGGSSNGNYVASEVEAVSENWQIGTDGNWHVDQWIYSISLDGDLTDVTHNDLIENQEGDIVSDNPYSLNGPTDPAALSQWGQELAQWYGGWAPSVK